MKEKNAPLCECEELHSDIIEKRRAEMPEENTLYDLSDFFKVLGFFNCKSGIQDAKVKPKELTIVLFVEF